MYTLVFAPQAIEDLSKLKQSELAAFKKAGKLLTELQEHPKTGTGKPEPSPETERANGPGASPRSIDWYMK
jgi:Txe/YoeB family toxin of Txe-Axe toxin-antitoxin module